MIRRKYILLALFTLIFQLLFSTTTSNTISFDEPKSTDSVVLSTNSTTNQCQSASVYEFPQLFFTIEQSRRGGFLVYIALIIYSFAAIEIVCDDYFASALERISCNFNLTPVGLSNRLK